MIQKNKIVKELTNELLDKIKEELQEQDRLSGDFTVRTENNAIEVVCKFYDQKLIDLNVTTILSSISKPCYLFTQRVKDIIDTDRNFNFINN